MRIANKLSFVLMLIGSLALVFAATNAQTPTLTNGQTFERVKVLIFQNGKTKEVAARLRLTGTEIILEEAATGKAMATLQNDELKASEYYYSKHRRWQPLAISAAMVTFLPFAVAFESDALGWIALGGLFSSPFTGVFWYTHSKRHWLTLRATSNVISLRLDKRHYKSLIAALENQTKLTVNWHGER